VWLTQPQRRIWCARSQLVEPPLIEGQGDRHLVRFGPNIESGCGAHFVTNVAKRAPFSTVRSHAARRARSAAIASLAHV
jgi:hypothetical protein